MRILRPLLTLSLLLAAWGSTASASVPDPSQSTIPDCFTLDPGGDLTFQVTVRDIAGNPIAGSFVWIDVCECPDLHLCPSLPGLQVADGLDCTIEGTTDAAGRVTFAVKGGGSCVNQGVRVFADGVLLRQMNAASPDQDGDLTVLPADLGIFVTKLGGSDPTGDFDCDGDVDAVDQAILTAHLGHSCDTPTPARPMRWGTIKLIYR